MYVYMFVNELFYFTLAHLMIVLFGFTYNIMYFNCIFIECNVT